MLAHNVLLCILRRFCLLLMVVVLVFVSALANIHENKKQPQDVESIDGGM